MNLYEFMLLPLTNHLVSIFSNKHLNLSNNVDDDNVDVYGGLSLLKCYV